MINQVTEENKPGTILRTPNIKSYSIGIGGFSTIGLLITIIIFHQNPNHRDLLKFIISATGVTGGITSAFYIGTGLRENAKNTNKNELILNKIKEERRIDRSHELMSEWQSSQSFIKRRAVKKIRSLIKNEKNNEKSIKIKSEINKNETFRFDIIDSLNHLERIARSIESEIADEKILYDHYRGEVINWHEMLISWITDLRNEKKNPKLYKAFTDLHDKWANTKYKEKWTNPNQKS